VTRRGMHSAGTGIGRDMLTNNHRHHARIERMLQLQAFQRLACECRQHHGIAAFIASDSGFPQRLGEHEMTKAPATLTRTST